MKTSTLKGLLKYALGLALLCYVIYRNWDPPESAGPGLKDVLGRPMHVGALLAAIGCVIINVHFSFVRWWVLVRGVGIPFRYLNAIRLGLVGYFFNTLLPGAVGGDVVKAFAIAREQSRRALAVSTVLFDRAIGLWGLVWMVAIPGTIFTLLDSPILSDNAGLRWVVRASWWGVAGTVTIWVLLGFIPDANAHKFARRLAHWRHIGHPLAEIWRAVWLYRRQPRVVALALLLSLCSQCFYILAFHFASHIFVPLDEHELLPSLSEHVLVVPIGMAIQAFFPAPGGVGGGEFGYGKLYRLLRRPEAFGVLTSLAMRLISWGLGIVGYIVYLRMKPPSPAHHPVEPTAPLPASS